MSLGRDEALAHLAPSLLTQLVTPRTADKTADNGDVVRTSQLLKSNPCAYQGGPKGREAPSHPRLRLLAPNVTGLGASGAATRGFNMRHG